MPRFNKKTLRIIEFLIIGVLFGLIEDIIAVKAVSDAVIKALVLLQTWQGAEFIAHIKRFINIFTSGGQR